MIQVSEISFDEKDLKTLSLSKLQVDIPAQSYLFLKVQNKFYLMLRAADFIDAQFKNKYSVKGVESFFSLEICEQATIDNYHKHWTSLKNAKLEKEKVEVIESIFMELFQDYWSEDKSTSFLNFLISCYDEFYHLDLSHIQKLQATSHVLYSRALQMGAHAVIAAMACGYTDFEFLKDLYNVSFVLDCGLVSSDLNWNIIQACEHERNNPHIGKVALKNILKDPKDYELFINHPIKSEELAKQYQKNFCYPEIIWAIKVHHEKVNGTGFPKGLNYSTISTWEAVIQYADYVVAFKEKFYKANDGVECFKKTFQALFMSPHIKSLPVFKVLQSIAKRFEWAQNKLSKEEVA